MSEKKLSKATIYGWVYLMGERVGTALTLGTFAPGKEMTYSEILAHVEQKQLDAFCMETLPAPFRFVPPESGQPLFNILTPEQYEAEFGDDDKGEN